MLLIPLIVSSHLTERLGKLYIPLRCCIKYALKIIFSAGRHQTDIKKGLPQSKTLYASHFFDKIIISLIMFPTHKCPLLRGFCVFLLLVCYLRRTADYEHILYYSLSFSSSSNASSANSCSLSFNICLSGKQRV